jgi:hypothetical protein
MTREDLPGLEWNGEFSHFRNVYLGVYRRMQQGTNEAWVAEAPREGIVGQCFYNWSVTDQNWRMDGIGHT